MILDEPTAPLDTHESKRLFTVVKRLQQQGIGVVFISHRIHELKAICDTLTVLRDGKLIESGPMAMLSGEEIVEKMLGHELSDIYPPARPPHSEETLLRVEGLHDEALLKDISCICGRAKFLALRVWRERGKPNSAKRCLGPAKPRDAWRTESSALAAAQPGGFGAAWSGAGAGRAAQGGHLY